MKNNRTTALLMLLVFLLVVAVVIIFLTGLDRSSTRDNPYENVTVTGGGELAPETPAPTPSAEPTVAPTSAPVYYPPSTAAPASTARPVATAAPTAAPAAAATPTPSPSPTPLAGADPAMLPAQELIPVVPGASATPTSTPGGTAGSEPVTIPIGTVIGSGSFRSDTGTSLNIRADWTASISSASTVDVTVTVYAEHYGLQTTATPEALGISVDGQYVSLASPGIEYDGNAPQNTQINARSFSVNLGAGEHRDVPVAVSWQFRGTYSGVALDSIDCGGNIFLSR